MRFYNVYGPHHLKDGPYCTVIGVFEDQYEAGKSLTITGNGEQRRDTDKNIRGIVGEYEDFILTALSVQGNNTGFIEKTQTERKELLSKEEVKFALF